MREHLSGKIGPADTQDTAYYFLSPGVGVVAMISQEDGEAWAPNETRSVRFP